MADERQEGSSPIDGEPLVMSPDLQFSVLCDDVRQEGNGKLILIGLFEAVRAKMFPVNHPLLFIVNRWRNGAGTFTELTRVVSASNEIVVEGPEAKFTLASTHTSHTVIHRFPNTLFQAPGTYWVEVDLDGGLHRRYPVRLVAEGDSAE
ncbi:MAG: hypothetical protein HQ592_05935 [Planctomycetes bacterium]|nr:hypothetical protein [Planctomycetota bacterium]